MGKVRIRSRYRGRSPQNIVEAASAADVVNYSVTGVGGDPEHPNEPAGFTPLCENNYEVCPGLAGGGGVFDQQGATGWWWRASGAGSQEYHPTNNPGGNVSIQTNGGHPLASTYLRIRFPAGLNSGSAPAFYIGWNVGSPTYSAPCSELYTQTLFRWVGPASDPSIWAWEPTLCKMYYTCYMGTNRFNQGTFNSRRYPFPAAGAVAFGNDFRPYPLNSQVTNVTGTAQGGGSNTITLAPSASGTNDFYNGAAIKITSGPGADSTLRTVTDYDGATKVATVSSAWPATPTSSSVYAISDDPGGGALHFGDNVDATPLDVGTWYMAEDYVKLNTQTLPPTSDGIRKYWVDGTLRGNHTTMRYTTVSPWNLGFHQYRFDPVWGGVNPITVPEDQYLDIAYSYVSGVPI